MNGVKMDCGDESEAEKRDSEEGKRSRRKKGQQNEDREREKKRVRIVGRIVLTYTHSRETKKRKHKKQLKRKNLKTKTRRCFLSDSFWPQKQCGVATQLPITVIHCTNPCPLITMHTPCTYSKHSQPPIVEVKYAGQTSIRRVWYYECRQVMIMWLRIE